ILQCQKPLPSTESLDDFLFNNHYRSEKNLDICHAHLNVLKDACYSLAMCCRTIIKSCEEQLNSSELQDRLRESVDRLIRQHNDCEKNILETIKLFRGLTQQEKGAHDFRS
ncbi:hypothetical protein GCK32_021175, partial [Trichostrongylus colubriformis]